ncbi:hypothetical protein [Haloarchaeobius sp. DFWS5]|uniref:hypothetical protein n=1 Tax=Haloarchaeobius sp. DFWS5 TaxID=3446114 RepID=UPI003EBD28C8
MSDLRGGVRVLIHGDRLNQQVHEESIEWRPWHPEYVGELVNLDLWGFIEAAIDLAKREVPIYSEKRILLHSLKFWFSVEPLNIENIRISYRRKCTYDDKPTSFPKIESAHGYILSVEEFCQEVYHTGLECVNDLHRLEISGEATQIHMMENMLDTLSSEME